jgi:flagellin-like hook-associated protein FlgL
MRISDSFRYTLFQANVNKVGQQLDDLARKISTQKNINVPSDDPVKFATSVLYDAERSAGSQFSNNLQRLSSLVGMYDTSFSSIGDQLANVTQMCNTYDTMDDGMRQAAGEEIKGIIEQLVTVGNTRFGNTYIFGGKQADTAPLQLNSDYSVTFTVDQHGEDTPQIYVDKSQTGKFGISGREAFYGSSKIAFGSVSNGYTGDIYSNSGSFAYVVDGSNNTMYVNGAAVSLTSDVYTGGGLAKQVQKQLGSDYTVAFDSTSRKFLITNNTGAVVTFNWSNGGATAGSVLGFDNIDSVVAAGGKETSDLDAGRKSFLAKITNDRSTSGGPTYQYSIDGGNTWSADIGVTTGGAATAADITIDDTNNAICLNGAAVTLTDGVYTGASLAGEIQTRLGPGFTVTYDAGTRKFDITNSTGTVVTFNWSDNAATAAGVLGFDNVDSTVSSGTNDSSDFVAGMFIDGKGIANTTNNRIKLLFGTGMADNLTAGDTFSVKDLSVFELLKNLKDAFDAGNSTWVSKNTKLVEQAIDLTRKNNAVIAFEGTQAKTLIDNNKRKDTLLQTMQSDLVNADTSELATQFNALLNTYQALLSALAKMQSISVLNYLNSTI